jgi:hypothetical protein
MFTRCANPDCEKKFDYREGRLIRFCKPPIDDRLEIDRHRVEHFWLCGTCSNYYVFEYQCGVGMKIKPRVRELRETAVLSFIKAA